MKSSYNKIKYNYPLNAYFLIHQRLFLPNQNLAKRLHFAFPIITPFEAFLLTATIVQMSFFGNKFNLGKSFNRKM